MIMKHYFPGVDTGKLCYEWPADRSAVINTDFQSYAFLSAFCHGTESAVRIGHRLLCEQRLACATKRDDIVQVYCKASRVHDLIRRVVRAYKVRHAAWVGQDQDLFLAPMASLPERLKCSVYDASCRRIYCFRTTEFLRIAVADLTRAPDFIVEPCPIKNPYTNIPFSSPQLYHLIAQARCSGLRIPIVLRLYEELHFNLADLRLVHEPYLRALAIDCFVRNATLEERADYMRRLVQEYHSAAHSLSLHEDFPPEPLVDALSGLLRPYLVTKYSLSPAERYEARSRCRAELSTFARLNPRFGRGILCRARPEFALATTGGNDGVFVFGAPPASTPSPLPLGPLHIDFITRFVRRPASVTPRSRRHLMEPVRLPEPAPPPPSSDASVDSDASDADESDASGSSPDSSSVWLAAAAVAALQGGGEGEQEASDADGDNDP